MCMSACRVPGRGIRCARDRRPDSGDSASWGRPVMRQVTRKCIRIFLFTPHLLFLLPKFQECPSLSCDPRCLARFGDLEFIILQGRRHFKSHSASPEALRVLSFGSPWSWVRWREIWAHKVICPQNYFHSVGWLLDNSQCQHYKWFRLNPFPSGIRLKCKNFQKGS